MSEIDYRGTGWHGGRCYSRFLLTCLMVFSVYLTAVGQRPVDADAVADWQTRAGGKMAFDVAAIRPDPSGGSMESTVPLTQDDFYIPNGGHFHAAATMARYIEFAYKFKPTGEQRQSYLAHLPAWVSSEAFVIDARAPGNPTKDQMRLMMQSLLAERFHLALHFEERIAPVMALVLAKPRVTGPRLRLHSDGPPCPDVQTPQSANDSGDVFPPMCHEWKGVWADHGQYKVGARDTTMGAIANSLSALGNLGRPVIDETGLKGTYDFTLEWDFEVNSLNSSTSETQMNGEVVGGASFFESLKDQLGLKLKPTKAPVRIIVIDRIERPTAN